MGYLHIENLYKNQTILLFRECYAMEKIHGTSAHISWNKGEVGFFSGGVGHPQFVALFNAETLAAKFKEVFGDQKVTVYGEAYGGKCQGMSATYGTSLRFVVFDVQVGDVWLNVPAAENVAQTLGLEFVHYVKTTTDLDSLNYERDSPSVQAHRNGNMVARHREGVVLRPLVEMTTNNGSRVIAKHKRAEFGETRTPRDVTPEQAQALADADAVAQEWVTAMRLEHVLDKMPGYQLPEDTGKILAAMTEDVLREGAGEIVDSRDVRKAIGKATAALLRRVPCP